MSKTKVQVVTEDSLEETRPIQAQTNPIVEVPAKDNIDRINNVKQKESALHKAGASRKLGYDIVVRAATACKWNSNICDSQGNVVGGWEDDIPRQQWAAEMLAKYYGDFVIKPDGESNGIRQLVIIRPGAEAGEPGRPKKVEGLSRPIHIQSKDVSRDVQLMGHGKNDVINISGHVIQRADTK